jgi:transcriptional regulator with XRE-family HTH domain
MNIFENIETIAPAIRAGRNALDWSQKQLADKSGISLPTMSRLEADGNPVASTVLVVISALRAEGIFFDWREDGFELIYKPVTATPIEVANAR